MKYSKNLSAALLFWGGLNGFLAVALGAFGAHSLKDLLETNNTATIWQTASHYHLAHAIALVLTALLADKFARSASLKRAGAGFLFGILLFSGSLYALALTNVKVLGAITPFGGLGFMAGWILLLVTGIQNMEAKEQPAEKN